MRPGYSQSPTYEEATILNHRTMHATLATVLQSFTSRDP